MSVFLNSILLVLGLIFGSFVSALSWRMPRGIPIAKGRSVCPNCKEKIAWFDNIPLLSFLLLGGKCRHCRKRISLRYPLIELTAGIGFLLIGLNPYRLVVFLILLAIFVIDLERQIIPDSLVFLGLFFSLFFPPYTQFSGLLAGFISASLLLIIHLATRGRGMGLGDVKFAVWAGLLVGIRLMPVWLFAAFLTVAIAGVILILAGRAKLKSKIAFGPFLIIGIPVSLVWGEKILALLLSS